MVLGHIPRGHVLVRIQEENLGMLEVPKERCKGDDGWMRGVSWDQNSARNYLIGVSGEESTLPMQGMLVPSLSGHLRSLVEKKIRRRDSLVVSVTLIITKQEELGNLPFSSYCYSVTQSCVILCHPTDCSTQGLPVRMLLISTN